jgi:hypothetical protein
MEYQNEYASKGVGGTALGLSIGALGAELLGGTFGNILGGGNRVVCSEDHFVNRYELNMQKDLTNKDMEIAYLRGRDAAKNDSLELYRYIDGKFNAVEAQISAQAVVNAQVAANIGCMQRNLDVLNGLTKTVIPIDNVCPQPMPALNSWTAPTTAG